MQRYLFFLMATIVFVLGLSACTSEHTVRMAEEGYLNLSDQQWQQKPITSLRGEWEFYWNQLLSPNDWQQGTPPERTQLVNVPSSWTNYRTPSGQLYPAHGYATYRLRFHLDPENAQDFALKVPMIWAASKVWLNGEVVYRAGVVGKGFEATRGQVLSGLVGVPPSSDGRYELIVQVSNYGLFISGLLQDFEIGIEQEMILAKEWESSRALMWLGILSVMGLYHFILFLFRTKNRSTLYFGIICLIIAIRLAVFGEHYVYEYLQLHTRFFTFEVQPKIYYIGTYVLAPLGLLYMRSLYPQEFRWKSVRLRRTLYSLPILSTSIITTIYCLFILFAPLRLYGGTLLFYQPFFFIFLAYLAFVIVRAAIRKREDAWLQLSGALVMMIAGINDGIHTVFGIEVFGEMELLPVAFGIFLFLQFFVLARRFSRAFNQVEDLSENLERKVITRTQELSQKTEELEQTNKKITDSVRYASRIQQSILGTPTILERYFSEAFVLFRPRDIVSGDFYWFGECPDKETYVVIAADCTGHGVPGAFMTVMGNDLLNEIINQEHIFSPRGILEALDAKVKTTLHRSGNGSGYTVADGMDMAVLSYHKPSETLRFAGAKNPLLIVRDGEPEVIKGSKFPIGGAYRKYNKSFEEHSFPMQPGDRYYLYSDGFQDQFGGKNNGKYLSKRFRRFLVKHAYDPLPAQKAELEAEFEGWKGEQRQTDDLLVIGLCTC